MQFTFQQSLFLFCGCFDCDFKLTRLSTPAACTPKQHISRMQGATISGEAFLIQSGRIGAFCGCQECGLNREVRTTPASCFASRSWRRRAKLRDSFQGGRGPLSGDGGRGRFSCWCEAQGRRTTTDPNKRISACCKGTSCGFSASDFGTHLLEPIGVKFKRHWHTSRSGSMTAVPKAEPSLATLAQNPASPIPNDMLNDCQKDLQRLCFQISQ